MARTIVCIVQNSSGDDDVYLVSPPHATGRHLTALNAKPSDQEFIALDSTTGGSVVSVAGHKLMQGLMNHAAINLTLTTALSNKHGVSPLYIELISAHADDYPWESLFHNVQQRYFLERSGYIPIGRIVSSINQKKIRRTFTYDKNRSQDVVKVLAVLSAAKESAVSQWNAIKDAYDTVVNNAYAFAVDIHVVAAESKSIVQTINNLGNPHIKAEELKNAHTVFTAIRREKPNLLYFFSHGDTKPRPHLELASAYDWSSQASRGSVSIDQARLEKRLRNLTNVWLVVLNACQTAKGGSGTASLAMSLVSGQAPTCVGNSRPITNHCAHTFAKGFFREFFDYLENLKSTGLPADVEWIEILKEPREEMLETAIRGNLTGPRHSVTDQDFEDHRDWILPVCYTMPSQTKIGHAQSKPASSARHSTVSSTATQLRQLGVPPDVDARLATLSQEADRELFARH